MGRYAAVSAALPLVTADDLGPFIFVHQADRAPSGDRVGGAVRGMDVAGNRSRTARFHRHERTRGGTSTDRIDHTGRIADRFDAHS